MEIDMINRIEYPFDDIEVVVNGYTYTASGVLPVEYAIDPVDTSVGIFWPSAIIDGFGPVEAELVDEDGAVTTVVLHRTTDAHNKIALTLEKSGCLEEACLDDYYGR
jgi:hypothetical protein